MNSHLINKEDILMIEFKINNMINIVKHKYSKKIIELLSVDAQEPKIPLKATDYHVEESWTEFMSYDFNMITLQIGAEFPMSVWFSENIGKSLTDMSWREHELKRLYLTKKHKVEDFKETVKAYNMDRIQNKDK